jgi:5-methyltetrahydropteroyltriglutamate--homocysteine methyltransferase
VLAEEQMKRSSERILTTHVGSLVRPKEIVDVMRLKERGEAYDVEGLATRVRETVKDAVKMQAECGIDIPSDGEFSKSSFSAYVTDRMTGWEAREGERGLGGSFRGRDRKKFAEAYAEIEGTGGSASGGVVCAGPIKYIGEALVQSDIANFKAALEGVPVEEAFMPAVAPGTVELQRRNVYYKTQEEYLFAIAEAMKTEYRMIVDAGFVLQIDDPRLVTEWDSMDPAPTPEEYAKFADLRIEAINHALEGIPEDRVRFHMCWGSWHGPHTTDIELKDMIGTILKVRAGAISLEAANPRHAHEYHVWERVKLPEGKVLIPGCISHNTNGVEHPELVSERIQNYARLVGRENVIAGADCGFAQAMATQRVHPTIMWEKFRSLAEGARLATKALWG